MLLLVGLGNPGNKYAYNRHNIGFRAVDEITRRHGFGPNRKRFHGLVNEGMLAEIKTLVLKPQTFMNESGRAVQAAMSFYKAQPKDIVVFHDELDLAGGKLRIKRGGGHAGHNGLRSIHAYIGPYYARVRLGISHPGDKARVVGHVLKDFSKVEGEWVGKLMNALGDHFPRLVKGDDGGFMSKVTADLAPPKIKKAPTTEPEPPSPNNEKES